MSSLTKVVGKNSSLEKKNFINLTLKEFYVRQIKINYHLLHKNASNNTILVSIPGTQQYTYW